MGLIEVMKKLKQKKYEKDDESTYYMSPNETKFYAKKNDSSIEDIIERIFQLNSELEEVLERVKASADENISKSDLLMYLGYIFVKEGNKKNQDTDTSLIKYCSIAVNENVQRFCDLKSRVYGSSSINDIYNEEGITEKKQSNMIQHVNIAKLAFKEVKHKKTEVKERDEKY